MTKHKIMLGLGNYYGDVEAFEENGMFYMRLGNWDEPDDR